MSLKHFHVAFISICTLFFAGLGAWCLLMDGLPPMFAMMGWLSLACGVAMLVYGVRFLKKVRRLV